MSSGDNVQRSFGYAIESERPADIDVFGLDADFVLQTTRATWPDFNPFARPFNLLKYQGNQGACQGHSLAQVPQIMMVQSHAVQRVFSRACGYYESQRKDGLAGRDVGSTLRGGQMVLSEGSGLVLESAWPYPSRYDARRPSGFEDMPAVKVPSSKRLTKASQIFEFLAAGCCVQTGVTWNNSFEQAVSDQYSRGGRGGHSTLLYGLDEQTGAAIHHNSWQGWQSDGRSLWTERFLAGILSGDRNATFIAYQPAGLQVDDSILQ